MGKNRTQFKCQIVVWLQNSFCQIQPKLVFTQMTYHYCEFLLSVVLRQSQNKLNSAKLTLSNGVFLFLFLSANKSQNKARK